MENLVNPRTDGSHLQILNKKAIKIELYDSKVRDPQLGGEVTSPFILEPSSDRFHPAGLFSEVIFGEIGSTQRFSQFGYINLHTSVLHPMVFLDITRSRKLYKEIMAGNVFVKFDEVLGDFIQCKPDDVTGNTGYSYFINNFPKIKWENAMPSKSLAVEDKVKLIKKYPDRLLINKMLIIPAELREYKVENGRGTSDQINDLYLSLLNLARIDRDRTNKDTALYDPLRYRIQLKVLEISNYIKDILKDDGYMENKYGSRAVAWATRNVISPITMTSKKLGDPDNLKCDESAVPLFQCAKAFQLLVVNKLRTIFFSPLMSNETSQITAINKKTFNLEYIEISEKEKQRFITDDGLGDLLNLFKNKEYRRNHLVTYDVNGLQYFLYLVYDDGKEIFLARSKSDMEKFYLKTYGKTINPNKLRPLTLMELVYIATYLASYNKHVLIARYPITFIDSMYPSKIKLMTTTPSRNVVLKSVFNEMSVPLYNYPDIRGDFIEALKVHPSRHKGLGSDHDGDQLNTIGVISPEANKEIDRHINSLAYYVNSNGSLTIDSESSYLINMTLYNMSYME